MNILCQLEDDDDDDDTGDGDETLCDHSWVWLYTDDRGVAHYVCERCGDVR